MKVSLDTNILINEPNVVFDSSREFVLSFTVVRELDRLKRNPDLKRAAQTAIRNIWAQYLKDQIEIINIPDTLGDSPDEQIVQDTKDVDASLLSDDIGARIIAKAHGVDISTYEVESNIDFDYKGYITIQTDSEYEKHYVPIKEMQLDEFNELFSVNMKHNMYCIIQRGVVIEDTWKALGKNDIWKRKENKVSRISQSTGPLRDAGILATPMDSEQQCAIDAVIDAEVPLTIIDGTLGTGWKTA